TLRRAAGHQLPGPRWPDRDVAMTLALGIAPADGSGGILVTDSMRVITHQDGRVEGVIVREGKIQRWGPLAAVESGQTDPEHHILLMGGSPVRIGFLRTGHEPVWSGPEGAVFVGGAPAEKWWPTVQDLY